jgi:hypothetical protein
MTIKLQCLLVIESDVNIWQLCKNISSLVVLFPTTSLLVSRQVWNTVGEDLAKVELIATEETGRTARKREHTLESQISTSLLLCRISRKWGHVEIVRARQVVFYE